MSGSAATAVFGAAPAQADSYQDINAYAFLKTIRENGSTGSNDVLLGWGHRVCADLHAGYSPSQISRAVWLNTGIAEERDAAGFAGAAAGSLCPEYNNLPYY